MENDDLKKLRHSASHVMAQAVKTLYPEVKFAIGPPIDSGFYYDFDMEHKLSIEDFDDIESEMKKIIKQNFQFKKKELTKQEALGLMKDQPYKIELINGLPENEKIFIYTQGNFTDLCAGPHIESTGKIKSFKLISVAGAYWRGSEKNKMLQRLYATAFETNEELETHLLQMEEAKKRDHRKLGTELKLYTLLDEGPGFPFFLPKGLIIKNELENFWKKEHFKRGYDEIKTPIILNQSLWIQSGHWDHYKDNMYTTIIDEKEYALKPMNCPGSILVYKIRPHSYKELPIRLAELGIVHRHENSGNLHGLMRVRCFTQDDAHIIMTPEQTKEEITKIIKFIDSIYNMFGFKYDVELSTRPQNSMGTDEQWEQATNGLEEALNDNNIKYTINKGDGAFYGPKIDFHLYDCLKRIWQCGTIQLDFQMPKQFGIEYVNNEGEKCTPVMIHRVIFGSIERFIGILTEHFAGEFPTWLAPVHVKILPISEKYEEYCQKIMQLLRENEIRFEVDFSNEKFGKKLRAAITEKVPYTLIIGNKEQTEEVVTIRNRVTENQKSMSIENFISVLKEEITNKSLIANMGN